jgi:5'-3' exonuclease
VKLLLIDGHYYAYRSFFAIQSELRNSAGLPTNAIYGFVKTVRKMLVDVAPSWVAVCWDKGLPARRTQLQPEYKMNRAETPEALGPQIDFMQDLVPKMGLASLAVQDTEADDLIASYTVAARQAGIEVVLATNDKDLFQLVDGGVRIYSTNKTDLAAPKDTHALLGEDAVKAKWLVNPAQIGDVLALIGDTVDNIPGVEGIGPKTAANLITQFGTLDDLMANLPAVKSEKVRAKLEAAREKIAANREMVRLDLDLPLPVPLTDLTMNPRWEEYVAALRSCEFKGLLAEVEAEAGLHTQPEKSQGELF